MSPQEQQAFRLLSERVLSLEAKVSLLEEKQKCCCKSSPHYRSWNTNYFNDDGSERNLFLLINDRFPLDNNCVDDKGIFCLADCTLYVTWRYTYNPDDSNSGWQIEMVGK